MFDSLFLVNAILHGKNQTLKTNFVNPAITFDILNTIISMVGLQHSGIADYIVQNFKNKYNLRHNQI